MQYLSWLANVIKVGVDLPMSWKLMSPHILMWVSNYSLVNIWYNRMDEGYWPGTYLFITIINSSISLPVESSSRWRNLHINHSLVLTISTLIVVFWRYMKVVGALQQHLRVHCACLESHVAITSRPSLYACPAISGPYLKKIVCQEWRKAILYGLSETWER